MSRPATRPTNRVVLHVDMDAFFASVELLRRPELRGLPVVVGGAGPRGVIAAASYEARRYGVHSAMPSTQATRLCPHAVFLAPDHAHYAAVSTRVQEVFQRYTPLVEPLALDEAFLDLTGAGLLFGDGPTVARAIRASIGEETGLVCSVGVAPNKFLAKLASEAAKPTADPSGVRPGSGVVVVRPGEELAFLHPHPLRAMWGVGPVTQQRLAGLGVRTIGDLAALDEASLVYAVGAAQGRHLAALALGVDDRPVEPGRRPKSIGHEETFTLDVHTSEDLHRHVVRMADLVAARLRRSGVAARTATLKVRFAAGFRTITRSATPTDPLDTGPAIVAALAGPVAAVDPAPGLRLIGVSGSNLVVPATQLQLDLLAEGAAPPARWAEASAALDEIRARYGPTAIGPASTLGATAVPMVDRVDAGHDPCETADVPLSEEEQRILRQIEEQLQSDQRFANAVSSSGLYRHSARTLRWAIAGLVIGLALLVLLLQVHYLLSFAAFLGMLACVLVIERTARAMGKAGIADVAASMRRHRTNASSRLRRKG